METKDLFYTCLEFATTAIEEVQPADHIKPTPCTEWDVLNLASHMLYELAWAADIVAGKTIAQVGSKYDGDLVKNDLQASWRDARNRALQVVEAADLQAPAHLSWGTFTVDYYLQQVSVDLLIHAWDLSAALGEPIQFTPKLAKHVHNYALRNRDMLRSSGLFGEEVKVAPNADLQTKIVALFGRDATRRLQ